MRKPVQMLVLIVSVILLLTAMNQSFINRIKQDRYFAHLNPQPAVPPTLYQRLFVRSDRWRYGDLYGLCYLPQYKHPLEPFTRYPTTQKPHTNRVLYIIGDSFLADKMLTGAFSGFDNVVFLDRRFPYGPIQLDSAKQNYLLLEFAERNLSMYSFAKGTEALWNAQEIKTKTSFSTAARPVPAAVAPSYMERLGKIIFNKDLSRNIELLLFDDKAVTPLKEAKASLNYALTGWLAPEVAVSTDKKRLFLNITVDTSSRQSAFRPESDQEVNLTVTNLAEAKKYYQSIGFKGVILSIVPNAVSVYDSRRLTYNHLLQRVEQQTQLPVVSLYGAYKSSRQNLFYLSDAHWNPTGMNIWVKKTDSVLTAQIQMNPESSHR